MHHLSVVPARPEDAIQITPYLRSADKAELEAVTGLNSCLSTLLYGVSFGKAWAMKEDFGELELPFALFGVLPFEKTVGIPWMVATDDLIKHKKFFVKTSREYIPKMQALYPGGLFNYIDARNKIHIDYIKHFGFEIDGLTDYYGMAKLPFLRFALTPQRKEGVSSAPLLLSSPQ
jgi:hypothetical protein